MRLIDADVMRQDWLESGQNEYVYDANAFLDSIDEQPTIDAVPVVRCKDCKHWNRDRANIHRGECLEIVPEVWINENDFCSYGVKKDE